MHGAGKTSHNVYFPEDWKADLEEIRRDKGLRSATAVWVDAMAPIIEAHRAKKSQAERDATTKRWKGRS